MKKNLRRIQDFRWMPLVYKDILRKHICMFTHRGESKSGYDDTGRAEKTNYFAKNICIVKQISSSSANPKIVI